MKMQEPTENLFLKELMPILQIWKIDWHTDKVTVYQRTFYHLKILLLFLYQENVYKEIITFSQYACTLNLSMNCEKNNCSD